LVYKKDKAIKLQTSHKSLAVLKNWRKKFISDKIKKYKD